MRIAFSFICNKSSTKFAGQTFVGAVVGTALAIDAGGVGGDSIGDNAGSGWSFSTCVGSGAAVQTGRGYTVGVSTRAGNCIDRTSIRGGTWCCFSTGINGCRAEQTGGGGAVVGAAPALT